MYLQEIVISPDIFEKIGRAFEPDSNEDIDLKSYKENLALKKIVFEKGTDEGSLILNAIEEMMENFNDFGKHKMNSVLKSFLLSNRVEFKTIDKAENYTENEIVNTLLNLGLITESKIINAENKTPKKLSQKHSSLTELEVLDFHELIKPGFNSRVLCKEKTLSFKKGERIDFQRYISPYISGAEELTFNDRYLRLRKGGFLNLMRLIKTIRNPKSFEIRTIQRDDLDKFKPDISCAEVENEIRNIHGEAVIRFGKAVHERFIETEHCKIIIDPGFDFVNENYFAERNDVSIHFKIKEQHEN